MTGPDLFGRACVLADLVFGERGLLQQLATPLVHCGVVGREDERLTPHGGHRPHADDRLACAAGKHHDTAPALDGAGAVKRCHGGLLIRAERERGAIGQRVAQRDGQGTAVHVAGQVVNGPAQVNQIALEFPSVRLGHPQAVLPLDHVALADQVFGEGTGGDQIDQILLDGHQQQAAGVGLGQELEPAIAGVKVP